MVPKFFVTNSFMNKNNKIIKPDKFLVYKYFDNNKNIAIKNTNNDSHPNIKFKVYNSRKLKNYKILQKEKMTHDKSIYSDGSSKRILEKISNKEFKKFINSSKYRGVSKNGNKWQVLLMNDKIRYYFGNYNSEEVAAKIYDFFSLKFKGNKAKTNFFYSEEKIKKIFDMKI